MKYREFWIDRDDIGDEDSILEVSPTYLKSIHYIHVIEYSYAEDLEEKLRVAVEALMYLQTKGCSLDNCAYKCDLAREALESYRKFKGE